MNQIIAIAAGGAVGSLFRFWLANGVYAWAGRAFPYGTLVVNVLGCGAMGFLFVLFVDRLDLSVVWRAGVLIGVLGGFTTFSTFSIETFNLIEQGSYQKAALNVVLSVTVSLMATWFGVILGRQV